jgi:DNA-binding transcriptional LysR family regulator
MEFYHLRSFVVVAKTTNLTLAAKQLCTTPPAISAHIKALEEELQTPLFIRSSKGMTLTEKGEILLLKAQKTLDSALELVNVAASTQDEIMGTFHLAINQSPTSLKIRKLAENIHENIPGVTLQISSMATGKIIEAVRAGTLDGGYVYGDMPDDFFALTVKQQSITTIAPYRFKLDAKTLQECQWITMGFYCPFDDFLTLKIGHDIHSVLSSDDESSRLELVKSGLGLSFYEQEEAEIYANDKQISLISDLNFDTPLHFVIAKKRIDDPVVKAMLQEIRVLWDIAI